MGFVVLPEFDVAPARLEAFLAAARADAAASLRDEPGCLRFDVATLPDTDPVRVVFYEVYADRAAFDAHLATPHLAAFRAALPLAERELPVRFLNLVAP